MGSHVHPLQTDKMHFCTFPGHNKRIMHVSVGVVCYLVYICLSQVEFRISLFIHMLQDEHEITLEELYRRLETNPDEVGRSRVQEEHTIMQLRALSLACT